MHSPRHNESPLQQYTSTKLETPPVSINTREVNCGILIQWPLDENRQASAPHSNMNRNTVVGKKDKLVGHTCNLNTWEIEAGELDSKLSLVLQCVQGHPELYETRSLKVKLNLKDKGGGRWGKRTDTKDIHHYKIPPYIPFLIGKIQVQCWVKRSWQMLMRVRLLISYGDDKTGNGRSTAKSVEHKSGTKTKNHPDPKDNYMNAFQS